MLAAQLLGTDPDSKDEAVVHIELARLHVGSSEPEEALEEARRALELSGEDSELTGRAEWVIGSAHRELGDTKKAHEYFGRASERFSERSRYRARLLQEWAALDRAAARLS
jgi:tetratricopeptide (TPR) repeat protein